MSRSRSWWRTGAGIVAWILIAGATAALAWAAVRVVADTGDEPATLTVPAENLVERSTPPSGSGETSSSGTQPPTGDATSPPDDSASSTDGGATSLQSSRVIASIGGNVSVACTGSRAIRLVFASPANGWQMEDESDDDGLEGTDDEIEVTFVRGEDEEIRVRARCDDGNVDFVLSD